MEEYSKNKWVGRISYLFVIIALSYLNYLLWTSPLYILLQAVFLIYLGFKLKIW